MNYPATSLGRLLDQSAGSFTDAPALSYGELHSTYRDLLHQVNRMAGSLASMGVRCGDHVMITLQNCPEYIVGFLAAHKLGAVVVNAGPLMGVDDCRQLITGLLQTPIVCII